MKPREKKLKGGEKMSDEEGGKVRGKNLVKILHPHLCLGEPRFQNSSFLDNYPTVQAVLNLWARLSRKAPTEWMPGLGEIIFYTQQKRPPGRLLPSSTYTFNLHPPPPTTARLLSRRRYLAPIQNWLFYFPPSFFLFVHPSGYDSLIARSPV